MRHARSRVAIEHKTREADDFDGKPEQWNTFTKTWCNVKPLNGKEMVQAQQIHENVTHRVRVRPWLPGVTNQMRIDLNGRKLNINSAINVNENNRMLEMMCSEVT